MPAGAGVARPRSKTFEEYSKETADIWDDREDLLELSLPSTDLEFSKGDKEKKLGATGEGSPKRRNSKGKGKCECLVKSLFRVTQITAKVQMFIFIYYIL